MRFRHIPGEDDLSHQISAMVNALFQANGLIFKAVKDGHHANRRSLFDPGRQRHV